MHACCNPRTPRLQSLGTPDLAAVSGDSSVVGHVLRFEGLHRKAAPSEGAGQSGDKNTLANIGAGACIIRAGFFIPVCEEGTI